MIQVGSTADIDWGIGRRQLWQILEQFHTLTPFLKFYVYNKLSHPHTNQLGNYLTPSSFVNYYNILCIFNFSATIMYPVTSDHAPPPHYNKPAVATGYPVSLNFSNNNPSVPPAPASAPPPQFQSEVDWSTGLCDCFSDCKSCKLLSYLTLLFALGK